MECAGPSVLSGSATVPLWPQGQGWVPWGLCRGALQERQPWGARRSQRCQPKAGHSNPSVAVLPEPQEILQPFHEALPGCPDTTGQCPDITGNGWMEGLSP